MHYLMSYVQAVPAGVCNITADSTVSLVEQRAIHQLPSPDNDRASMNVGNCTSTVKKIETIAQEGMQCHSKTAV